MKSAPEVHELCAGMILDAVRREYPSHVSHLLLSAADARPPRELTPAFYGSFDWHSAVHGHWALARLLRSGLDAELAARARAALDRSLTPANLAAEVAYLSPPERQGFERPYGLAWLLQLAAELREWDDPDARRWHAALEPLERLAADRLHAWLAKLPWPVRTGLHSQTAFALGLAFDWSVTADDPFHESIRVRAREWFRGDRDAPIAYEPSGVDFLSPVLGEADLMRRVLDADEYVSWFMEFLPDLNSPVAQRWLTPVESPDPADGHLAHLGGLNLSRAWMLDGIAWALPRGSDAWHIFLAAMGAHSVAGRLALRDGHYAGTHWLGSFAVYLLTRRGFVRTV